MAMTTPTPSLRDAAGRAMVLLHRWHSDRPTYTCTGGCLVCQARDALSAALDAEERRQPPREQHSDLSHIERYKREGPWGAPPAAPAERPDESP